MGPGSVSRVVAGAPRELWKAINHAAGGGPRGLPGDSSLAELLAEHRGTPCLIRGPKAVAEKTWAWEQEQYPVKGPQMRLREGRERTAGLTIAGILAWADAHHAAHGHWPRSEAKPVEAAPDETWTGIDYDLRIGRRGLSGRGASLGRLLVEHRGPEADHRLPEADRGADPGLGRRAPCGHGHWPTSSPLRRGRRTR